MYKTRGIAFEVCATIKRKEKYFSSFFVLLICGGEERVIEEWGNWKIFVVWRLRERGIRYSVFNKSNEREVNDSVNNFK